MVRRRHLAAFHLYRPRRLRITSQVDPHQLTLRTESGHHLLQPDRGPPRGWCRPRRGRSLCIVRLNGVVSPAEPGADRTAAAGEAIATVAAAKPATADRAIVIFFISACLHGRKKQLVVLATPCRRRAPPDWTGHGCCEGSARTGGRYNIRGAYTGASADLSISTTERRRVPLDTKCAHCSRQGTVRRRRRRCSQADGRGGQGSGCRQTRTLTSSSSSFPLLPWTYRTTPRALQVLRSWSAREHRIRNRITCSKTADFAAPVFPGITYLTSVIPVISGTLVASGVRSPKCSPGQGAERRLTRWRSSTSGKRSLRFAICCGRPSSIRYRRRTLE